MIGRYSLASVSIQSGILAVQPLSLSFSIVLSSFSIFHATFNYERLSRCQGDVTREVTGGREKKFLIHRRACVLYQPITSRGRRRGRAYS